MLPVNQPRVQEEAGQRHDPGREDQRGRLLIAESAGAADSRRSDGYILSGFNDSVMTMAPNTTAKVPWDIVKVFGPVSLVATVEWGWADGGGAGR